MTIELWSSALFKLANCEKCVIPVKIKPYFFIIFLKREEEIKEWKASKSGKYVYKIWETILIYIRTESDILQQCASANIDGSIAVAFKFHYADMLEEQRWCQKRERMLI